MSKSEYLKALRREIISLPKGEINKTIEFYDEMIEDFKEQGFTEEEAVEKLLPPKQVARQILSESSEGVVEDKPSKETSKRLKDNKFPIWLIILGFPLWFPLLIVIGVLIFIVYLLIWLLTFVYHVTLISLAAISIYCLVVISWPSFAIGSVQGLLAISGGLIVGALAIFMIVGSSYINKGAVGLSKGFGNFLKGVFVK